MKSSKRTVKYIANKLNIDVDELLVNLWYFEDENKFLYLKNSNSIIRQKDLLLVGSIFSIEDKISRKNDVEKNKKIEKNDIKKENDFNFSEYGNFPSAELLFLNKDDILTIHNVLVKDFENLNDPIYPPGVKNEEMFESAIFHPQTSFGGILKYPTIESAAAAIMYSICQNHCFHNGNKRTALVSMLVFLDRHNISLSCQEDDLFKMALSLADHKLEVNNVNSDSEIYFIYKWICINSKGLKRGERVIKYRRLKQILARFNCNIKNSKIERVIERESRFFGKRRRKLSTSITIFPPGHEVDIELIKKIRKDLELDCDHNVDLDSFYYDTEYYACEFVEKYKNLLRRLSKF